jgi:hypothetical protein
MKLCLSDILMPIQIPLYFNGWNSVGDKWVMASEQSDDKE